jgi:putative sigma-54 modulation protein
MNISITFRHMAPSEAIKSYASDKLGKLQKMLRQPLLAKVTLSIDRLEQIAEARVSSGGEHLEAKEGGDDMYASIDKVMSKLERQLRASKGAVLASRRGAETVRTEPPRAASELAQAGESPQEMATATPRTPVASQKATIK